MSRQQIDRHLAERRQKQKRRRKYFWGIAAFLALYFIVLGVFWFFVRSPAFQANKITIQGNSAVPTADIMNLLQASIIRDGDSPFGKNSGVKAMLGFNNLFIWPDALPSSTVATIPQLAGVTIAKNYFFHTITVTVTERQPFAAWCTMLDDNCFWFDAQGVAFAKTLDTEGDAIMTVHDYAGEATSSPSAGTAPLALGEKILPDEFIPNMISIINALEASNLDIQNIALNDLSLEQINVTTVNGPAIYFSLRFSADEDLPVLQSLIAKPGFDKLQYIDFTVENRAYYK